MPENVSPTPPATIQTAPPTGYGARRRPVGLFTAVQRPATIGVLGVVIAVGCAVGLSMLARPGVHWAVLGAGAGSGAFLLGGAAPRPALDPRMQTTLSLPADYAGRILAVLAVALLGVAAVSDSASMVTLCLLAALGLAMVSSVRARRWPDVLLAPMAAWLASLFALRWLAGIVRRQPPIRQLFGWLRGLIAGLASAAVVLVLLASADDAFASALDALLPPLDATIWLRIVLAGLASSATLAMVYLRVCRPRWERIATWTRRGPVAEWALPLILLNVVLTAFLVVQAAVLFQAFPQELLTGQLTPAERARHGFGELVLVTLVVAATLGWTSLRTDPHRSTHRRLMIVLGGGLLVLSIALALSALRRMWLYERAFGATVLRLEVAVFEIWLVCVLAAVGVAWLVRRSAIVPRLVVGSAGLGLLLLGLARPDAVVAGWNVDRYARTHTFDTVYARQLSADAIPQFARLPQPLRRCVLVHPVDAGPWYAFNVSRHRAADVLREHPVTLRPDC